MLRNVRELKVKAKMQAFARTVCRKRLTASKPSEEIRGAPAPGGDKAEHITNIDSCHDNPLMTRDRCQLLPATAGRSCGRVHDNDSLCHTFFPFDKKSGESRQIASGYEYNVEKNEAWLIVPSVKRCIMIIGTYFARLRGYAPYRLRDIVFENMMQLSPLEMQATPAHKTGRLLKRGWQNRADRKRMGCRSCPDVSKNDFFSYQEYF